MTSSDRERVVITGLGSISCLGSSVSAYWDGLLAGGGEPAEVPLPDLNVRVRKMYLVDRAQVPPEPSCYSGVDLGSSPRLAVAAAGQALSDAGLGPEARGALPVLMGVEARQHRDAGSPPQRGPDEVDAAVDHGRRRRGAPPARTRRSPAWGTPARRLATRSPWRWT